jgi:hypothetical protein
MGRCCPIIANGRDDDAMETSCNHSVYIFSRLWCRFICGKEDPHRPGPHVWVMDRSAVKGLQEADQKLIEETSKAYGSREKARQI